MDGFQLSERASGSLNGSIRMHGAKLKASSVRRLSGTEIESSGSRRCISLLASCTAGDRRWIAHPQQGLLCGGAWTHGIHVKRAGALPTSSSSMSP